MKYVFVKCDSINGYSDNDQPVFYKNTTYWNQRAKMWHTLILPFRVDEYIFDDDHLDGGNLIAPNESGSFIPFHNNMIFQYQQMIIKKD